MAKGIAVQNKVESAHWARIRDAPATPLGVQNRARRTLLEHIGDQRRIAKNVRADLQHRRLAVAAGERGQVGFRHDVGDVNRRPVQPLESQDQAHFLRERRHRIMVQDELLHAFVQPDQLFAEILPLQHADERRGRRRQPLGDGLAIFQFAGRHESAPRPSSLPAKDS